MHRERGVTLSHFSLDLQVESIFLKPVTLVPQGALLFGSVSVHHDASLSTRPGQSPTTVCKAGPRDSKGTCFQHLATAEDLGIRVDFFYRTIKFLKNGLSRTRKKDNFSASIFGQCYHHQ
ncbi:unnamed protein product [Heterobilharzia americana]|nr:unnamed protein product [Heterobilharzia americana]